MSALSRVAGIGAAASLALGLLAGGSVLAAIAGPRQAQATGTRSLQQTVDALPAADKSVVATTDWNQINIAFGGGLEGDGAAPEQLATSDLDNVTSQLRRDFGGGPLTLDPQSADWAALTSAVYMPSRLLLFHGYPAELEVAYRYPLAGHVRLVAGSMPTAAPPAGQADQYIQVVVTAQTARTFGLTPGSELPIDVPSDQSSGEFNSIRMDVTGIVEPTDPGSQFWTTDPLLPEATLSHTASGVYWVGAFIADPGELGAMQQIFGQDGLKIQWQLPVDATGLRGEPPALYTQVNAIIGRNPAMSGYLAPVSDTLTVTSGLLQPLSNLVLQSNAVNLVLLMVYVGLAIASAVMLLLAARMIADRRSPEFALLRARGASLRQLFSLGFLGAALTCVPAAALAWALAVLLIPNAAPPGPAAWWPGLAALLISTAGPGLVAARRHRLPGRRRRRGRDARRRRAWVTRVVVEVTVAAAALGGIVVARSQAGLVDLYASAAPVLVAVLAVIVILRVYQVLVHALARLSARRRGVVGFVGLSRASTATVTFALPAVTLVLAVTIASFTGMVKAAVGRSETIASWQTTGADVSVAAPWAQNAAASLITPAQVASLTQVPGVRQAASILVVPLSVSGGAVVTGIVVDPAGYAALSAESGVFPPLDTAALTARGRGGRAGVTPVLASPQAAADLAAPGADAIAAQQGLPGLRVRVAGVLASTPAMPAGGAFMVLPQSALGALHPVNLVLLNGSAINLARVRSAAGATDENSALLVTTRAAALQAVAGAPLQQGTFLLFALAIGYSIALALAVLLLQLSLGAADREVILGRLATMGLPERRRGLLAAVEVLPAIVAAAVAAIACAVVLPQVVGPAVNLSVFTRTQASVPLRPDVASLAIPLAGLLLVTLLALGLELRSRRRRGVAVTVRGA